MPAGQPPYVLVYRTALERRARLPPAGGAAFDIALDRINGAGHAEFREGELRAEIRRWLGRPKPIAAQTVSSAIAALKAARLVGDESSARCIVVCADVAHFGATSETWCATHRSEVRAWGLRGPQPPPPPRQKLVVLPPDKAFVEVDRDGVETGVEHLGEDFLRVPNERVA